MEQGEKLLTSQEAISVFTRANLSEPTFRRRIQAGNIVPVTSEKKKGGAKYPESQVYAAAGMSLSGNTSTLEIIEPRRRKRKIAVTIETARFLSATVEDMPEIASIIKDVFGAPPDVAHWSRWLQHNSDVAYILRSNTDDRVVGVALIMAYVNEKKITDILANEVGPTTNPEDLVKKYVAGLKTSIYIRSVGVLPGVSKTQKRVWGSLLIRGLQSVFAEIGSKGVIIDKLFSRSETGDGISILRHLGFTEIVSVTSYRNFMIDVPISGLNMIIKYKRAFTNWQKKHSAL
jgi:hypothetical protein